MSASINNNIKIVNVDNLNFRKGPSTNYEIIQSLPKNTQVEIVPQSDGWILVRYKDTLGFVSSKYLSDKIIQAAEKVKKYVNVSVLNFRSGPSTKASILGTISKGSEVEVISTSDGWSKIKYNGKEGYVASNYLSNKITNITQITTSISAEKIIEYAKTLLGQKYVWADEGPETFDCSGFTWYVYKNIARISLPRSSKEQGTYGTYISKKDLQPGDLVFFDTVGAMDNVICHVGIYLGNNQFIHASSSQGKVVISQLDSDYYSKAFVNGRRVLK
ncbi:hypothetical protein SDC9_130214 [bioreactor metagenome]|uniref:Uncharacterized protein n=1 Tax=bioreactor metagenome TaxID=1076179 RepID=A0A645D1V3_9ZZZZ